MVYVIRVKFLSKMSISPNEFFATLKPVWSATENSSGTGGSYAGSISRRLTNPQSVVCMADCDSVEELSRQIAIMPGAGVESIEILPLFENQDVVNN